MFTSEVEIDSAAEMRQTLFRQSSASLPPILAVGVTKVNDDVYTEKWTNFGAVPGRLGKQVWPRIRRLLLDRGRRTHRRPLT